MGRTHVQSQIEGHRMNLPAEFLSAIRNAFEANKRLADRAVEQVPDDKLHTALDAHTNSIAVIMKHVAGIRQVSPYRRGRQVSPQMPLPRQGFIGKLLFR
jgi:hypothetical protein